MNDIQAKIIILDGDADSNFELAKYLLDKALGDPERSKVINELVNDERINRRDLFATAWAFGMSEMINALQSGKVHQLPNG